VGYTRKELIDRMEANGTMDDRRAKLRAWFDAHPKGMPEEAVRELRFTFADHMHVVADGIWNDRQRAGSRKDLPSGRGAVTEGRPRR
jgi:hypothetical protein